MTDTLAKADLHPDPFRQFDYWLKAAWAAGIENANAMALATAGKSGEPTVRMVLLKEYDKRGYVFYTNFESVKARQLAENPRGEVAFYWRGLRRQVRIAGRIERLSAAESEGYFKARPRESQLSATASPQSRIIPDRAELEAQVAKLESEHAGNPVPWPEWWGGFRLIPDRFEFWQNRPNRLHDRFRYRRQPGGRWPIERLGP